MVTKLQNGFPGPSFSSRKESGLFVLDNCNDCLHLHFGHTDRYIWFGNSTMKTFWFLIFIGESIKCWVCRSDGDPKCADPFDNTSFPIADCRTEKPREHLPGLEPTMCRKVRQKGKMSFGSTILCSLLKNTIIYSQWKLALYSRLRLAWRAWSWSRWTILYPPFRYLQHPCGILYLSFKGWL